MKRQPGHSGIQRDACALGVSRITLYRALSERFATPRHAELRARYRQLVAERQSQEVRGIVLSPGFSFRPTEHGMAEQLAAAFPESLTLRGSRLEVLRPLILCAPNEAGIHPASAPKTSLLSRAESAISSALSGTGAHANPSTNKSTSISRESASQHNSQSHHTIQTP